jgi:HK97 gp10 family phage protein
MPRTLSKHSIRIRGLYEAIAAFAALPQVYREELNIGTAATTTAVEVGAKAHVVASPSIRTRALLTHITSQMNTSTGRGRIGVAQGGVTYTVERKGTTRHRARIVIRRAVPSKYAHFVEFGTKHMPAEPFLIPSARAQRDPYIDRCKAAVARANDRLKAEHPTP